MTNILDQLQQMAIDWQTTQESAYVFQTVHQGQLVHLRLNDFPDEPLCTVIVDDIETDLHEFPSIWTLPRHRGDK